MNFEISDSQRAICEAITAFASDSLNDNVKDRDENSLFDRSLWEMCGSQGLLGLMIPEEYGGAGLNAVDTFLALEAFGYGCQDAGLAFSVAAHQLACAVPIWKHGSDSLKMQVLPKMCSGKWIATNAMTETESGSDPFQMKSRAIEDGDEFILTGQKNFCSNGPVADVAVAYAMTNPDKGFFGGISAFALFRSEGQFQTGQQYEKMGLRTCPISELLIDSRVPADQVIGKPGGGGTLFTESMNWERACLGAIHMGALRRNLDKTITFVKLRKYRGQPLTAFQGVSHQLAEVKAQMEAARLTGINAAWHLDTHTNPSQNAAMAKWIMSEAYKNGLIKLQQLMGGYGYLKDYDIERSVRDAMAATIYSGTTEMMKNIVSGYL